MAGDLEIEALASLVDRVAMKAERGRIATEHARVKAVHSANVIRSYRAVFLDEHGDLTALACDVIADIADEAQLGRFDQSQISDAMMRERNGKRALALHILSRLDLDGSKLRKLARRMREGNNG